MIAKTIALVLGLIGYIAGLVVVATHSVSGFNIVVVTAGLADIALTAPFLGYVLRTFIRKGEPPTTREHMILSSFGLYMATASMLMIYLKCPLWRPFSVAVSVIIGLIPLLSDLLIPK